ncbi:MAG: tRNA (uridine(54)-C5)-methyltransferase TrmA, partial [Halieaceae bacterium]|nr:tRNA (uridine(54)-C5)-methyltransferase TrmA [Halieaceae bacterium]
MPLSAIQPDRYEQLLDTKVQAMAPRFADYFAGKHLVVPSAPTGFRMRAEFRIWHEGDDLNYVMFRRGEPKQPIPVAEFPIVSPVIQDLMPRLRDALRQTQALRKKLFQVEFLSTLRGDMIVTLIYHRALEDDWATAAEALSDELGVSIIGRS